MIENPRVRVLDASTAFRTAPDWVYGFPELTAGQEDKIRAAKRVSNPGCYPTGTIALLRPLVERGLLPPDCGVTVNAISGYSGGGNALIAMCEKPDGGEKAAAFCLYGLDQNHKHVPEMRLHAGLRLDPVFLPAYSGAFYRGMLIAVALRLRELAAGTTAQDIHRALVEHYMGRKYVQVEALQDRADKAFVLTPLAQNETNHLQLRAFAHEEKGVVVLTACLDNLGKGAAGAAVQNLELMLGVGESRRARF
jgi:N-acetyl-gamma-glutamyl-phosphate reductase